MPHGSHDSNLTLLYLNLFMSIFPRTFLFAPVYKRLLLRSLCFFFKSLNTHPESYLIWRCLSACLKMHRINNLSFSPGLLKHYHARSHCTKYRNTKKIQINFCYTKLFLLTDLSLHWQRLCLGSVCKSWGQKLNGQAGIVLMVSRPDTFGQRSKS